MQPTLLLQDYAKNVECRLLREEVTLSIVTNAVRLHLQNGHEDTERAKKPPKAAHDHRPWKKIRLLFLQHKSEKAIISELCHQVLFFLLVHKML